MPEEEMNLMPLNYVKKFSSFLIKIENVHNEVHLDQNKEIIGFYEQIKDLKELKTDAQRQLEAEKREI